MNNKYQDALDYLASLWEIEGEITVKSDPFDRFNRVETLIEDKVCRADRGNVKILQKLVDKETPKKYKSKTDKDGRMIWVCPKCNEILVKFWSEVETVSHLPYCYMCGQKLDWSNENE